MKKFSARGVAKAFTLIELLIVIATIMVLAAMLLPHLSGSHKSLQVLCMSRLKQNALGLMIRAEDHQQRFPWQVSINESGTHELIESGKVSSHFQAIAKYVRPLPQLLVCPFDKKRRPANGSAVLSDANISYFVEVVDWATNSASTTILLGDRNLQANGKPVTRGTFLMTTNLDMNWTSELHRMGGNLAFADGHAQFVRTQRLNAVIQPQPLATNRLLIP